VLTTAAAIRSQDRRPDGRGVLPEDEVLQGSLGDQANLDLVTQGTLEQLGW
jgi:hypothetical protein